jgi:ribosomal protein S18 acetylase RimI-like enzyme
MTCCRNIVLRTAAASDALGIYNVLYYSWNSTYAPILGAHRAGVSQPSISAIERWLLYASQHSSCHFRVALAGTEPIGFGLSRPEGWTRRCSLDMLYVHPDHLGRGVGKLLLDDALEHHSDYRVMRVEVIPENERAKNFYEKHGFREICRTLSLATRLPVILMQKPLSGYDERAVKGWRARLFR